MAQGIEIADIAWRVPENAVTNEALERECPAWDMRVVEERAGVKKRYIVRADETALDLAAGACRELFGRCPGLEGRVDALLFCTQSPDYIMPPNSAVLHGLLELGERVFALDYNLACSGFPYGLAMAQGLAAAGLARNILLVTADTYSKYIHPQDRSARVLFGDGAAATWLRAVEGQGCLLAIECATCGKAHDKFIIPAGGCRRPRSALTCVPIADESGNVRTLENIQMDGMGILKFVSTKVAAQVRSVLAGSGLGDGDIALYVFHQASKLALDSLARQLRLPDEKVFRNIESVGNTVSASIPIALKEAWDRGRVARGDRVLLSGFGVGLSWSTAVVRL